MRNCSRKAQETRSKERSSMRSAVSRKRCVENRDYRRPHHDETRSSRWRVSSACRGVTLQSAAPSLTDRFEALNLPAAVLRNVDIVPGVHRDAMRLVKFSRIAPNPAEMANDLSTLPLHDINL